MGFFFTTTHQALDIKDNQNFYTNQDMPNGLGFTSSNWCILFKKTKSNVICLSGEGGLQNEHTRISYDYA